MPPINGWQVHDERLNSIYFIVLILSLIEAAWDMQAPSTTDGAAAAEPNTAPLPNPWAPNQPGAAGGGGGGAPPGLAGRH